MTRASLQIFTDGRCRTYGHATKMHRNAAITESRFLDLFKRMETIMQTNRSTLRHGLAQAALSLALLFLATAPARAELGGSVAGISADQQHMQATRRMEQARSFTRHVITTQAGVQVTEYASPAGKVFAVSWQGPFRPDLQQLLGAYFNDYVRAAGARHGGRRPVAVTRSDLVIRSSGHMRSFFGYAYLPEQLPAGTTLQDIR
jgi:hypothetical protein